MPQVTFLMSTWNGAEFLRPAIDSLLAQTFADFRVLVVDDCSPDDSADIASSYDDPRVRVERLDANRGQTGALNHGLSLVETEWTARIDQDDLAAPERLERQLEYVASNPGAVAVGSWADFIDEGGRPISKFRPPADPAAVRRQLYSDLEHNPLVHSAVTFRTEVVRSAGGYPTDLSYAQDTALWMLLAARGDVANVPEVLTYIRVHGGQTSGERSVALRQLAETLDATANADELLGLDEGERRAWLRGRARIHTHLMVAARSGGDAARRLGAVGRAVAQEPAVLRDVAAVVGEGFRHRLARVRGS
jgi:glycosyltransferase involved in cell wall biosynthesis